jgi:hypothetical protein
MYLPHPVRALVFIELILTGISLHQAFFGGNIFPGSNKSPAFT